MQGQATREDLATLDTLFYFNRDSKKIRELRKQVKVFEKNVEERARIIEREERLKRERDTIEERLGNIKK
ncbi:MULTISPECIES: hypothetical protein [Proteiniphilum]|jgi:hypothetical protein|uniref:hypothetical protein n=1 Tax=Proteiniphilum TaxID=294702 RepID=UPI001EEBB9F5|nr:MULTISPECIES: hypothetical protein [Proteiniphilum]ULB34428.1 hypothetical protein KDN43_16000 [Proteiniphilum propionicum]